MPIISPVQRNSPYAWMNNSKISVIFWFLFNCNCSLEHRIGCKIILHSRNNACKTLWNFMHIIMTLLRNISCECLQERERKITTRNQHIEFESFMSFGIWLLLALWKILVFYLFFFFENTWENEWSKSLLLNVSPLVEHHLLVFTHIQLGNWNCNNVSCIPSHAVVVE